MAPAAPTPATVPAPVSALAPMSTPGAVFQALADVHATFKKWLGDDYDTDVLDVVLAAGAAVRVRSSPARSPLRARCCRQLRVVRMPPEDCWSGSVSAACWSSRTWARCSRWTYGLGGSSLPPYARSMTAGGSAMSGLAVDGR